MNLYTAGDSSILDPQLKFKFSFSWWTEKLDLFGGQGVEQVGGFYIEILDDYMSRHIVFVKFLSHFFSFNYYRKANLDLAAILNTHKQSPFCSKDYYFLWRL